MLFPSLCASISFQKNQHSDPIWRDLCGKTTYLNTKSGGMKGKMKK
jgi:hypothetical protein